MDYHNIQNIQINGGELRITNVTSAATGVYTCVATNAIGSSRANINLETRYDTPTIIHGPEAYTGSSGHPYNFTCVATGHPKPSITWTYTSFSHETLSLQQHKIYNNGTTIQLVDIRTSGILVCTAANEFGSVDSSAHIISHTSAFGK